MTRRSRGTMQAYRVRWLKVVRSPWTLLVRALSRAGRFEAAGHALARAALQGIGRPLHGHRTVLLGGLSRVGKSTLGRKLAARHGFRHIDLDYFVNHIHAVRDPAARARLRSSFYHQLLAQAPVGHVIEGDDLVLEDRWHDSDTFGREPLDPGRLGELARSFALPAFIVGIADMDPGVRLASLMEDDGWVAQLSGAELRAYAEFLVRGSGLLREGAGAAGVTYLELDGTHFRDAIEALATRIAYDAR
jgi:hypothetical protein